MGEGVSTPSSISLSWSAFSYIGGVVSEESKKYDYNQLGTKGSRVGQAVLDIMSKPQAEQTCEDTMDAFGPDYVKQIEDAIDANKHKYKTEFYIFVLTKKEFWATNVVRNWIVARQSAPYAFEMMEQYPNHTKTLYLVDAQKGKIAVAWSLPGFDDCITIARSPDSFNQQLVRWVEQCFSRRLDRDTYSFDQLEHDKI
jgi:hypothetical protein